MKLKEREKIRIREHVKNILKIIPKEDAFNNDYWITWSNDNYVNLNLDDDGDFQCAVFPRKPDGQIDMSEWQAIKLYEETNH